MSEDYPGLRKFVEQPLSDSICMLNHYVHPFLSSDIFTKAFDDISTYRTIFSNRLLNIYKSGTLNQPLFNRITETLNALDGSAAKHQSYINAIESSLADTCMLKNFRRNDSYGFILNHNITIDNAISDCEREGYYFMDHPFTDAEFVTACASERVAKQLEPTHHECITYALYIPRSDILLAYKTRLTPSIKEATVDQTENEYFISELWRVASQATDDNQSLRQAILSLNCHPDYIFAKVKWSDKQRGYTYC